MKNTLFQIKIYHINNGYRCKNTLSTYFNQKKVDTFLWMAACGPYRHQILLNYWSEKVRCPVRHMVCWFCLHFNFPLWMPVCQNAICVSWYDPFFFATLTDSAYCDLYIIFIPRYIIFMQCVFLYCNFMEMNVSFQFFICSHCFFRYC